LARLGLRAQRTVTAAITLLTETGTVVTEAVLGTIVQARTNVATISRPARVARARAINAFSVSRAFLPISWASPCTVVTTPAVFTGAHAIEAFAVVGAVIGTRLLGTVIPFIAFITHARHGRPRRCTHAISRAGRRAGRESAMNAREAWLAEARAVVAVAISSALSGA